jgi:ABC-type nitrate/sulfonate/bicarbonate transport system ATPase subunit
MNRLDVRIARTHYPGAPRPALESLVFQTGAGEIVGIVGPSGCGKSTLLNVVAGLDRAFEGAVEIDGRPAHGASNGQRYGVSLRLCRIST